MTPSLIHRSSQAFGTQFLDEKGQQQLVHQSSWGVSTRMIGGIIMTHGDDKGLRLPPKLAPVQVCWQNLDLVISIRIQLAGCLVEELGDECGMKNAK